MLDHSKLYYISHRFKTCKQKSPGSNSLTINSYNDLTCVKFTDFQYFTYATTESRKFR